MERTATGGSHAISTRPTAALPVRRPSNRQSLRENPSHTDRVPQHPPQSRQTDDNNVATSQRSGSKETVRQKFDDIFQVNESCENFGLFDIDNVSNDFSVAKRLNEPSSIKFFEHLGACDYVIGTLKNGHRPQLISEVPRYDRGNNKTYYEHQSFALGEIKNLISQKKVELVEKKPWVVNPLGVKIEPTKLRLFLDCSWLNRYVVVPSFKMDDTKTGLSFF